jgi:hypothetical protein
VFIVKEHWKVTGGSHQPCVYQHAWRTLRFDLV